MKKLIMLIALLVSTAMFSQVVDPIYFNIVDRVDAQGEVWVDRSEYKVEFLAGNTLSISRGVEYVQYSIIEPSVETGYYEGIEFIKARIVNSKNYDVSTIVLTDGMIILTEKGYIFTFYNE